MAVHEWHVLTFENRADGKPGVNWAENTVRHIAYGPDETLRIVIRFVAHYESGQQFVDTPTVKGVVEVFDSASRDVPVPVLDLSTLDLRYHDDQERMQWITECSIDIAHNGPTTSFRIRDVQSLDWRVRSASSPKRPWTPKETRTFSVVEESTCSFGLDLVPVTILYCPPSKDMKNSVRQNRSYGTIASVGYPEYRQSTIQSSATATGGLQVKTPDVFGKLDDGRSLNRLRFLSRTPSGFSTVMFFGFDCNSLLMADNENSIESEYWGPLGDLFVLLENGPWFDVVEVEPNAIALRLNADVTKAKARIRVIPAHRLLLPRGDGIASAIPPATRRRILELDPFLTNLDRFFGEHHSPTVADLPAAVADAPQLDAAPNTNYVRGMLVAKDWLDNGSQLELSGFKVDIQDRGSAPIELLVGIRGYDPQLSAQLLGLIETVDDKPCIRLRYFQSLEALQGKTRTARCLLIHNEKERPSERLNVWWDKYFSTFMFQRPWGALSLSGKVIDPDGLVVTHIPVELTDLQSDGPKTKKYRAITDADGRFVFHDLINAGTYEVSCGKVRKRVKVQVRDIESGEIEEIVLQKVKRIVRVREQEANDFEFLFGIPADKARRIQRLVRASDKLDSRLFGQVLRDENVSFVSLSKRMDFDYAKPRSGASGPKRRRIKKSTGKK